MGMFDYVSLAPRVRDMAKAQYEGAREIGFDGWQSKSFNCQLDKVTLDVDCVTVEEHDARSKYDHMTREVRFYQASGDRKDDTYEWIEFVAMYVDGKLVAVRHMPDF